MPVYHEERKFDASNEINHWIAVGLLVTFPAIRKALFWICLITLILGVINNFDPLYRMIFLHQQDVVGWGGRSILASVIAGALFLGLWLPSAIAAAAARKWGIEPE